MSTLNSDHFIWNEEDVHPVDGKKIHHLKCWPVYFSRLVSMEKTFEVRRNDRDFQTGDYIDLLEYDLEKQKFTGASMALKITYILHGGAMGIQSGFCVLGIQRLYA